MKKILLILMALMLWACPVWADEIHDALPEDLLTRRWNLGDNAGADLSLKDKGPYPAGSAGEGLPMLQDG